MAIVRRFLSFSLVQLVVELATALALATVGARVLGALQR